MKKLITLIAMLLMGISATFAQGGNRFQQPIIVNTTAMPTYTTGGYWNMVYNLNTGRFEKLYQRQLSDTVVAPFMIKSGLTGADFSLVTPRGYHQFLVLRDTGANGQVVLSDTNAINKTIMTSSYYGQYSGYPNRNYGIVNSTTDTAWSLGIGTRGEGYIRVYDSTGAAKSVIINPLDGILFHDTGKVVASQWAIKTASGNSIIYADTANGVKAASFNVQTVANTSFVALKSSGKSGQLGLTDTSGTKSLTLNSNTGVQFSDTAKVKTTRIQVTTPSSTAIYNADSNGFVAAAYKITTPVTNIAEVTVTNTGKYGQITLTDSSAGKTLTLHSYNGITSSDTLKTVTKRLTVNTAYGTSIMKADTFGLNVGRMYTNITSGISGTFAYNSPTYLNTVNATSPVTINLVNAAFNTGEIVCFKLTTGASNVTLQPGTGQINGAANLVLAGNPHYAIIFYDGTNFWVISQG